MDDEILSVEEAAARLKIAPAQVLDLLMAADLAGRNIGGEWRTTTRALLSFVDGLGVGSGCCGPGMCCTPVQGPVNSPASQGWS